MQEWRYEEGRIPKNSYFNPGTNNYRTSWLSIVNVTMKNEGNYSCYGFDVNMDTFIDDGVLHVSGK